MRIKKTALRGLRPEQFEALRDSFETFQDVEELQTLVNTRKKMISPEYYLEADQIMMLVARCSFFPPNIFQCGKYGITDEDLLAEAEAIPDSAGDGDQMKPVAVIVSGEIVIIHFADDSLQVTTMNGRDGFKHMQWVSLALA